jgi:hypothetical protein
MSESVRAAKGGHIVLNDEGMALFKTLALGKSGTVETCPSGAPNGKRMQTGEN